LMFFVQLRIAPDGKPVEVSFTMTESEADKRIAELTAKLKLAD